MRLRVGLAVVARIRVRHHVFLGIGGKVRPRASGRCMLKRVLEPGVVVGVGGGGFHSERGFESVWLDGHGFGRGLVLERSLIDQINRVRDWCF